MVLTPLRLWAIIRAAAVYIAAFSFWTANNIVRKAFLLKQRSGDESSSVPTLSQSPSGIGLAPEALSTDSTMELIKSIPNKMPPRTQLESSLQASKYSGCQSGSNGSFRTFGQPKDDSRVVLRSRDGVCFFIGATRLRWCSSFFKTVFEMPETQFEMTREWPTRIVDLPSATTYGLVLVLESWQLIDRPDELPSPDFRTNPITWVQALRIMDAYDISIHGTWYDIFTELEFPPDTPPFLRYLLHATFHPSKAGFTLQECAKRTLEANLDQVPPEQWHLLQRFEPEEAERLLRYHDNHHNGLLKVSNYLATRVNEDPRLNRFRKRCQGKGYKQRAAFPFQRKVCPAYKAVDGKWADLRHLASVTLAELFIKDGTEIRWSDVQAICVVLEDAVACQRCRNHLASTFAQSMSTVLRDSGWSEAY